MSNKTPPQRFLLIRLSSLGDILLVTPLLVALRAEYPTADIQLLVSSAYRELASLLPGDVTLRTYDKSTGLRGLIALRRSLRSEGFNVVLDLHRNLRSALLRRGLAPFRRVVRKRTWLRRLVVWTRWGWLLQRLAKTPDVIGRYFETVTDLGIRDVGAGVRVVVDAVNRERAIALAPGARHATKRWLKEYFLDVAQEYLSKGYAIRLFGSEAERDVCDWISRLLVERGADANAVQNFAGSQSLSDCAAELSKCVAAVTNDSGLMHLAAGVGTPIVAIFGATVPAFGFAPRGSDARIVENLELDCRPCTTIGSERCPKGHFRCMVDTKPAQAIVAIEEIRIDKPKSA